jgi:negative regulator of genetic competence, sporulation and motility
MLTKEQAVYVFEFLKINQKFNELNKSMMAELTAMLDELDLNAKGIIAININALDNKVVINYTTFINKETKSLDIYTHEGYDIYYDPASWEIAKREIKDIFFEVRKKRREKISNKPLTFWGKIKKWFLNF